MARPLRHGVAGGSRELVEVLERCRDEAIYDLIGLGLDLGELWRERRWHLLWLVLVRLPRHSLTKEKLAQDEEFVARMLEGSDESEMTKAIRQSEFTPEVEALYQLIDRTGDVVAGVSRLGGGKLKVPPMKRPDNAFDRVRVLRRQAEHQALVARVLPGARGLDKGFPAG